MREPVSSACSTSSAASCRRSSSRNGRERLAGLGRQPCQPAGGHRRPADLGEQCRRPGHRQVLAGHQIDGSRTHNRAVTGSSSGLGWERSLLSPPRSGSAGTGPGARSPPGAGRAGRRPGAPRCRRPRRPPGSPRNASTSRARAPPCGRARPLWQAPPLRRPAACRAGAWHASFEELLRFLSCQAPALGTREALFGLLCPVGQRVRGRGLAGVHELRPISRLSFSSSASSASNLASSSAFLAASSEFSARSAPLPRRGPHHIASRSRAVSGGSSRARAPYP